MKYSLKDFYTLDNMYYFPNVQDGIWVDEDEAQNIINEMNTEIEDENEPWDDYEDDAAWSDYSFGI